MALFSAIKSGLGNVGEALGLKSPSARKKAGLDVIRLLKPELYQYRPEAFQMSPVSGTQAQAAREEMAGFGETLRRRAAGEAPSLAQLQLQAGQQRAQQSLQSALAGMRGRQAGLGFRGLQQQFAEQGQSLNQQLAQLRAVEQAQAEQALGSFLGQRAQTELAAQEMAFREAVARQQAQAALEAARGQDIAALLGIGAQSGAQQLARQTQGIGSLLQAGGAMGAAAVASDIKLKEDVSPAAQESKDFLDALTAYKFKYKSGGKPQLGIMAQDAEQSEMGKAIVDNSGKMKKLDGKKTISAVLASLAYLNDRLNQMEGK
jgi:hypothetical protein